jgi:hypothetical protein
MCRPHLLPLILAIFCSAAFTANAWWWSDEDDHQQQITHLQYQVDEQEHSKDEWQLVALVLGVGCVITLGIGAAIGSKARRATTKEEKP